MKCVKILDCTLRDGGYVNGWRFSERETLEIVDRLEGAEIEYIEVGFLDENWSDSEGTRFQSDGALNQLFGEKKNLMAMIMLGEYPANKLIDLNTSSSCIKYIRLCFKKDKIDEAIEEATKIKEKGYKVFLQPASVMDYSKQEMIDLVLKANRIKPDAFYIVDTYGLMHNKDVVFYYELIDKYLEKKIPIGFHSHNNLQLSFSNSQIFLEHSTSRNQIIDATINGMGRGAGNLCTELIVKYLNDEYGKHYDLIPILEAVDDYIAPLFKKFAWGYSVAYYVAAINNCHPNYATYLSNFHRVGVEELNDILAQIPDAKKREYDEKLIDKLYLESRITEIEDKENWEYMRKLVFQKNVLVLAGGKSIPNGLSEIKKIANEARTRVMSVNYIDRLIKVDFCFFGNTKRYNQNKDFIMDTQIPVFVTSNISADSRKSLRYLSFEKLIGNSLGANNSGIMALKAVINAGARKVYLASYDGFDIDARESHYWQSNDVNFDIAEIQRQNEMIKKQIEILRKSVEIEFITSSKYDG